MNSRIRDSIDRIAEQARDRYTTLISDARKNTKSAAGLVKKTKTPLKSVSRLGLKISGIGHKTAGKVVKQQTKLVENQIDALANRLQAAAAASGIRDLVDTQVRMIPKNALQLLKDTRETVGILASAGLEVGDLLKTTVSDLRNPRPQATRAVKKTARKATRKSAPAKKAAVNSATAAAQTATASLENAGEAVSTLAS